MSLDDPYRSAPEPEAEPYLDRLPVYFRYAPIIGGWLAVRQTKLRFNPRLGRARTVPLAAGIDALRMSRVLDPSVRFERHDRDSASAVATWQHIAASPLYTDKLANAANPNILEYAYALIEPGTPYRGRTFTSVIDDLQLLVIEAHAGTIRRCFDLPDDVEVADDSGAMLAKALRWLRTESLARALNRVRQLADETRRFSREEVRAARTLDAEGAVYRVIGPPDDAIALKLSKAEDAVLDRWLAR